jgi:hypothetical protein
MWRVHGRGRAADDAYVLSAQRLIAEVQSRSGELTRAGAGDGEALAAATRYPASGAGRPPSASDEHGTLAKRRTRSAVDPRSRCEVPQATAAHDDEVHLLSSAALRIP